MSKKKAKGRSVARPEAPEAEYGFPEELTTEFPREVITRVAQNYLRAQRPYHRMRKAVHDRWVQGGNWTTDEEERRSEELTNSPFYEQADNEAYEIIALGSKNDRDFLIFELLRGAENEWESSHMLGVVFYLDIEPPLPRALQKQIRKAIALDPDLGPVAEDHRWFDETVPERPKRKNGPRWPKKRPWDDGPLEVYSQLL